MACANYTEFKYTLSGRWIDHIITILPKISNQRLNSLSYFSEGNSDRLKPDEDWREQRLKRNKIMKDEDSSPRVNNVNNYCD